MNIQTNPQLVKSTFDVFKITNLGAPAAALPMTYVIECLKMQYCQAQQASTQLKLSFALFSLSPTNHPPTHPPTRESIIQTKINLDLKSKVASLYG